MYQKVGIQKLSHGQIVKLLQGKRIRVKKGSGQEIHMTKEHAKKLESAHKRGCGITMACDPYCCQMNQHLKSGSGQISDVVESLLPIAKSLGLGKPKKGKGPVTDVIEKLLPVGKALGLGKAKKGSGKITDVVEAVLPIAKTLGLGEKSGGALMPAGYGVKKGRKGGKGDIGQNIGRELGGFFGNMLPI